MIFAEACSAMRAVTVFILAFAIGGCGKTATGDALIATGAVVAVVASQAATRSNCIPRYQNTYPCSGSTGNKRAQTAAGIGVAAGVLLAAAGQALKEEDRGTDSPQTPRTTHPTASWQLESEPEETEESEAEQGSEPETEEEAPDVD